MKIAEPYYDEDGVTIFHGDCRDVAPAITPQTVDLILMDPPYGKQFTGESMMTKTANIRADGLRQGMRVVRQALFELEPAWKRDMHLLTFCHWESWPDFYDAVSAYIPIKNSLIWHKARGGTGDTTMAYANDFEVLLYGALGRRGLAGKRPGAVIGGYPPVGKDRLHPTEKPEPLLRELIERHCPVGGTVLDPFMGVGSTLVAAKALGRRAIGIELDRTYCAQAVTRLRQLSLSLGESYGGI